MRKRPRSTLRRFWYIAVAGLVCTFAAAGYVYEVQGCYYTQVNLLFVAPPPPRTNALEDGDRGAVPFAAMVARTFNGNQQGQARLSSVSSTLFGTGIRRGHSVNLWDDGGQWQTQFDRPVIRVEVSDSTAELVRTELDSILSSLVAISNDLQTQSGTPSAAWIKTRTDPNPPSVYYVTGLPTRSFAMTLVLGIMLTIGLMIQARETADRRTNRRATREPDERTLEPV